MTIDGGGAGIEPDNGRVIEPGNDLIEDVGGLDAGIEDGSAIGLVVTAVNAAAGEVDADVTVFEFGDPGALGDPVPWYDSPGRYLWSAADDCNVVAGSVKVAGEDLANLAGASGDDDLHRERLSV